MNTNPKRKLSLLLSIICALLSLGTFMWGTHHFSYALMLFFWLVTVTFAYNVVRIYGSNNPEKKDKITRAYLCGVLVFYFAFLFVLTFSVGRSTPVFVLASKEQALARLRNRSNLIPFKTIVGLFLSDYSKKFIIINIFGNLAALMPLGVLFPLVFPKTRKPVTFTIVTTLVVVFIEIVQFVFGVGALDIDDLILNVGGALLVFLVYKKKFSNMKFFKDLSAS